MKNREIRQAEKELYEMEKMPRTDVGKPLENFMEKYPIHKVSQSGITEKGKPPRMARLFSRQ
jgi:hypothetical protein